MRTYRNGSPGPRSRPKASPMSRRALILFRRSHAVLDVQHEGVGVQPQGLVDHPLPVTRHEHPGTLQVHIPFRSSQPPGHQDRTPFGIPTPSERGRHRRQPHSVYTVFTEVLPYFPFFPTNRQPLQRSTLRSSPTWRFADQPPLARQFPRHKLHESRPPQVVLHPRHVKSVGSRHRVNST